MKQKDKKLDIMRRSGEKHQEIMAIIKEEAKPGVSTAYLNQIAEREIKKLDGFQASFKNYQGFPATICASINEEVVHGVPSNDRRLKKGDILSIDLGLFFKGYHVDAAETFGIGKISPLKKKLITATKRAVEESIAVVKSGIRIEKISKTMQDFVEKQNFNVTRELTGHGVGKKLHQAPSIPCLVVKNKTQPNPKSKKGQTLAIEAMVTAGDYQLKQENMAFKTKDNKPSAHFEDTIYVKKEGCEILT